MNLRFRIYKGQNKEGKFVAVKIIKHDIHQFDLQFIEAEVDLLSNLEHPNIIKLLDYKPKITFDDVQAEHESSMLVYELIEQGTLQYFIETWLKYFKNIKFRERIARSLLIKLINGTSKLFHNN